MSPLVRVAGAGALSLAALGLALVFVVPRCVVDRRSSLFHDKAAADVHALARALDDYAVDHDGRYPDSLEALVEPRDDRETYLGMRSLPLDPWGREYGYAPPSAAAPEDEPRVWTLGADGLVGGERDGADIDSRVVIDDTPR